MRKYKISALVGCTSHMKEIEAKNLTETQEIAWNYGRKLSNYGQGSYLQSVKVTPVKSTKVKR